MVPLDIPAPSFGRLVRQDVPLPAPAPAPQDPDPPSQPAAPAAALTPQQR